MLDNTWYYAALQAAKNIALMAGNVNDTISYSKQMKSIKDHFDKTFWNGKEYRSSGHTGLQADERGNAMAVLTGLAGKEKWAKINQVLKLNYNAGPYMEKFILEALFKTGAADLALQRMKARYSEMVNSKTSTLWEVWEPSFNQTVNHGWTGGPLALLMQYVAGISPIKPGFETFSVQPQLGKLNEVITTVPTKFGAIHLKINKNSSSFKMILSNPIETTAMLSLPLAGYPGKSLYLNKNKITSKFLNENKGIKEIKKDGKIIYQIKGGKICQIEIY